MPNNDNLADATGIYILNDGDTYTDSVSNVGYTREAGNDSADGGIYRTAWWRYEADGDGTVTITLDSPFSATANIRVHVYRLDLPTAPFWFYEWQLLNFDTSNSHNFTVTTGEILYLRACVTNDTDQTYAIRASGVHTLQPGGPVAAPPIDTDATFGPRNDTFDQADAVVLAYDGDTFESPANSNTDYGIEAGEPEDGSYRSGWWVYEPRTSDIPAQLDAPVADGHPPIITVYVRFTGINLPPLQQAFATGDYDPYTGVLTITPGTRYYIRVSVPSEIPDYSYILRLTGPTTVDYGKNVAAAPMTAGVCVEAPRLNHLDIVEAPAIQVQPWSPLAHTGSPVAALPISAGVEAEPGTLLRVRRVLVEPYDGDTVPSRQAALVVAVMLVEGELTATTVDIQFDTTEDFSGPSATILSQDVILVRGANTITLRTSDIDLNAWIHWRARLTINGITFNWTPVWRFRYGTGDAFVPVNWTTQAGATRPHLWSLTPQVGVPGQRITLTGQGFPAAAGNVKLIVGGAQLTMPIQSWTHVAGTTNADTDYRVITAEVIDPEHDEVVVLVPDAVSPGGSIKVQGDDGT